MCCDVLILIVIRQKFKDEKRLRFDSVIIENLLFFACKGPKPPIFQLGLLSYILKKWTERLDICGH